MSTEYADPVKVSPNNYRVLLENEHVRVLEMIVRPKESDAKHSHPSETVYFINGGRARIHMPDDSNVELNIHDGQVMWHEPWTHRVENTGDSNIKAIIVENKQA